MRVAIDVGRILDRGIERLSAMIDTQLADLITDSRRASKRAFEKKPRRFVRRVSKLVRRDAAPADAEDESVD